MSAQANENKGHLVSSRVYLRVGIALLILTAITVGVSLIPLGGYNLVIAMIIATLKALLVALFFMHLLYDDRLYLIILATALATLVLFIVLTLFDTLNRGLLYQEVGKPIREQALIYQPDTTQMEPLRILRPDSSRKEVKRSEGHEAQETRDVQ